MVTMAQRIEALRTEKGLSRPALSAALHLPKAAVEKFETGRQTPTQDQQSSMAAFFGVSLFYLRGESNDRTQMGDWLNYSFDEPEEPAPRPAAPKAAPAKTVASSGEEGSTMVDAFLKSKSFRAMVRETVLEVLRSPDGQKLIADAIRRQGR